MYELSFFHFNAFLKKTFYKNILFYGTTKIINTPRFLFYLMQHTIVIL